MRPGPRVCADPLMRPAPRVCGCQHKATYFGLIEEFQRAETLSEELLEKAAATAVQAAFRGKHARHEAAKKA